MSESLQGQVAIVTGASGALGSEVAKSLLAAGATVVAVDRSECRERASQTAELLDFAANLTNPEEVQSLSARLVRAASGGSTSWCT